HGLLRTEGARRTSQESLRSNDIAELRHRDAAKRERRRVVAQGDPVQCAERITRRECTRRGRDQRVHRSPVTLVTPTVRYPALDLSHEQQPSRRIENGTNDEGHPTKKEKGDDDTQLTRRSDIVMMAAMMLPSLVPMLWRYRQAVARTGETRLGIPRPRSSNISITTLCRLRRSQRRRPAKDVAFRLAAGKTPSCRSRCPVSQ